MTPPSTAGAKPKTVTTVPVRPALQKPEETANAMAQSERLALQVGQGNRIVIDHAQGADAGGRQIHQRRRAKAAGADHEHRGLLQRGLAGAADLAQHDMAGIAFEFVGAQHLG